MRMNRDGKTLETLRKRIFLVLADEFPTVARRATPGDDLPSGQVLMGRISDFQEILPIIENLQKPSVMPRHWQEVMDITKTTFLYEMENFCLDDIMDSPILSFKDDVEEVTRRLRRQPRRCGTHPHPISL